MKKLIFSTLLFVIVSNICFSQAPLKGLINYYPFSGDANDFMGSKNGIVNGATLTADRFGNPNSAYSFNGIKNYIEIPNYSSATFNTDFSISTWVKINNFQNTYAQIINGENNCLSFGTTGTGYPIDNINRLAFYTTYISPAQQQPSGSINGYSSQIFPASHEVSINVFHNIVICKKNDSLSFFLDGLLIRKQLYQNNTLIAGNKLIIGRGFLNLDVTDYSFNGVIDEIRIYNRSLSKSEITSLNNENVCFKQVAVSDTLIINTVKTSINNGEEILSNFKIFPNPTKDVLNIAVSNTSTSYSIAIFNSSGQSVYSSQLNNTLLQVNLSTLGSNGLYIIKIIDNKNNTIETRKLILE